MNREKSYCNSNGPDRSASNGNAPIPARHGWFCACHWCLTGVHA